MMTELPSHSSVLDRGGSVSSKPASQKQSIRRSLEILTGIAVFSAIVVFMYGSNEVGRALTSSIKLKNSVVGERRSLTVYDQERILEVVKETWPECINQRMNGIHCKTFIDEEILSLFTGDDRMTRTILVEKRSILDVFYNSVVILMGDNDVVTGRDGDGLVYYDFLWEGSGEAATDEACAEIPPVIAVEDTDGTLHFEAEPILVEGDVCDVGAVDESKPKAGGVVIDPNTPNCGEDDDFELQRRIDEALAVDIPDAGEREIPAFDCTCLSGYACCLLIKATVRDADIQNKAIQCHLNFAEGTEKHEKFNTGRGKHVNIFTNHNFVVNILPKVEGTWYDPADNSTAVV